MSKKSIKHIATPLGTLVAIADDTHLYQLMFEDHPQPLPPDTLMTKNHPILTSIEEELRLYFDKKLTQFNTPIAPLGTPFQTQVWRALKETKHGTTRSYGDLAKSISKPTAYRAVAQANGANPIVIIIPCHRIINSNGHLGGYSAGLTRKSWLLAHEGVCPTCPH